MTRIVCQVLQGADRVTFIWAEDDKSFEPYRLSAAETERFHAAARQARAHLAAILFGKPDHAGLASAGQELYRLIFREGAGDPVADQVRQWLGGQAVSSLDILSDVPARIPWNVVRDPASEGHDWHACWGARYPLAVGRRVNPWRISPTLSEPSVLVVLDPSLPADQQEAWQQESNLRSWKTAESVLALKSCLRESCPDVLFFAGRYADGLMLSAEKMPLAQLRSWIDDAEEGNPEPLVFLNVAGSGAGWSDFLSQAARTFPGLIAWEETPGDALHALGRTCLARMTQGLQTVGKSLQELRASQGWPTLALSALCPADVRLNGEPEPATVLYPLPDQPYRPLVAYDREDRPLFAGRDRDIFRCASLLDEVCTRLLLLHGLSGVGKSSFLRAGVIPFLEDDSIGYLALRDRTPEEGVEDERAYPVLSLHASGDLAGQLAEALCAFCAQPFAFTTPTGEAKRVALPDLLREALRGAAGQGDSIAEPAAAAVLAGDNQNTGAVEPGELRRALVQDADFLGRVLEKLTRDLPCELVILIEQGEQLVVPSKAKSGRGLALTMLAGAARQAGRCKIILSLRTDYMGRLLDACADAASTAPWREYTLPELEKDQLLEAVLWPTATELLPFTDEVPYRKYQIGCAEGFAAQLVDQVRKSARASGLSAVVLLQAVCARLFARARERQHTVLDRRSLKDIGGVDRALSKLVDDRLASLDLRTHSRRSLRKLMGSLYVRGPDGTITRTFMPMRDAQAAWPASDGQEAQKAIVAGEEAGLLEVQPAFTGGEESTQVGLSHDGLAWLAHDWDEDRKRQRLARGKVADALWITLPLICLAAALAFFFTRRHFGGQLAEVAQEAAKAQSTEFKLRSMAGGMFLPQYIGFIHQAQEAWQVGDIISMRQLLLKQQGTEKILFKGQERDLRGFEWYYLWQLANNERLSLAGHAAPVLAVAVSADSKLAATGSSEGKLFLWDLATGKRRATLQGHTGAVRALAFSQDGKLLASAGAGKTIYLWDADAGQDKHVYVDKAPKSLPGHEGSVSALVFRDKTLISAGADQAVIFWDLEKLAAQHTLKEHKAAVHALALAPKGKVLASGDAAGKLLLWDVAAAEKTHTLDAAAGPIGALTFSADGSNLASGSSDTTSGLGVGSIRLWDPAEGKPRAGANLQHGAGVFALAFALDGKTLFSGGKDHAVRMWDVSSGRTEGAAPLVGTIKGHVGWVRSLAVTPDGSSLVTGSQDAHVKVWDPKPSADAEILKAGDGPVAAVAISPDDKLLASAGKNGNVYLWNVATGKLLDTVKGKGPVTSLAFSKDLKTPKLAVASRSSRDEGDIKVFEVKLDDKGKVTTKEIFARTGKGNAAECLAIDPDGTSVAYAVSGNDIVLWDLDKQQRTRTLSGHTKPVLCLSFNDNGKLLVSGSGDHTIRLWDVGNARHLENSPLEGHEGPVLSIHVLPNNLLLSGGADQAFKIWDPFKVLGEDSILLRSFRAHGAPISSVSATSSWLFTASWDHTIKTWGQGERLTLKGHTGPVRALAATSDGQALASGGDDGTVRLWRAATARKKR